MEVEGELADFTRKVGLLMFCVAEDGSIQTDFLPLMHIHVYFPIRALWIS